MFSKYEVKMCILFCIQTTENWRSGLEDFHFLPFYQFD